MADAPIHHRVFEPDKSRVGGLGWPIGIVGAALVMLAIPISQFLGEQRPDAMEIQTIEIAMPPPPPPIEREEPPPPPEKEAEPPELDTPPPQLSLEQLDLALNPGTGGSLAGDFSLGNFDVNEDTLGGIDIFDVEDLDSNPGVRRSPQPRFDRSYLREHKGKTVTARIEFILNEKGIPESPKIAYINRPGGEDALLEMIKKWRFDPPMIGGKAVKARYAQPWNGKL